MLCCTVLFCFIFVIYIYIQSSLHCMIDQTQYITYYIFYMLHCALLYHVFMSHCIMYVYIYNPVVSPNGGCWCPIDNITFDKHKVMRQEVARVKKSKDVAIPFKRETMTEYYTRGVHSHLLRWFTTCVIMFYGGEYKYAWRFIIN
jgi:hypothetical protein